MKSLIGSLVLLFAVIVFVVFPYQGLSLMLPIGLIYIALGYFAAPLMAIIGVWSFKHEAVHSPVTKHAVIE